MRALHSAMCRSAWTKCSHSFIPNTREVKRTGTEGDEHTSCKRGRNRSIAFLNKNLARSCPRHSRATGGLLRVTAGHRCGAGGARHSTATRWEVVSCPGGAIAGGGCRPFRRRKRMRKHGRRVMIVGFADCQPTAHRFRTNQEPLDFSRVSARLTRVRLPEFVKRCKERFVKAPCSRGNCGGIAWRGTRYSLKSAVAASAMRSTSRVEVQIRDELVLRQ